MPLTALWKNARSELECKQVHQVIGFAGDGKLRDDGAASLEFREFLSLIPSSFLSQYANDCLSGKFENSGLALQDIINQVGFRLGFEVEQGRYRGVQGQIGFDGLWHSPSKEAIVVEVKTTDAYRIDLDTIAEYRQKLIAQNKIEAGSSSILIIVGRTDTGDLEAQVRGSRHAWDIRLISIDGLLRLMTLSEELDDPSIINKVRRVLTPQEYTKVDGIIDLVFSTAVDVKKDGELEVIVEAEPDEDAEPDSQTSDRKPKFTPSNFRDDCAQRVQVHLGLPLVKRSFAVFSSPDKTCTVVCINSRAYQKPKSTGYWFAFHPHQREVLENEKESFVALGCGTPEVILLIPGGIFNSWLSRFHKTELQDRFYWHIRVEKNRDGYGMRVRKGLAPIRLDSYLLPSPGPGMGV